MRREKLLQPLPRHPGTVSKLYVTLIYIFICLTYDLFILSVTEFYTRSSERSDLLKYAQQNGIPISVNKKNIKVNIKESWSSGANLSHIPNSRHYYITVVSF